MESSTLVKPRYTQLFINNEWVDSSKGYNMQVINPANEEVICTVQKAGPDDAEKAIKVARECFDNPKSEWRQMSAYKRSTLMLKLADLIEKNVKELASLESQDTGKPFLHTFYGEVPGAANIIRYYAGWCDKIQGKTIPVEGPYMCYTREEPVGVCAQIVPWNFPIIMLAMKWGPCLATGCCTILKTSEKTPLSSLLVAQLVKEAGFPPGVCQVLSGAGDIGEYLVKHPEVDKVAFTGSTRVGQNILRQSPSANLKRVTLELGGKSPNIVCHDADIDKAVEQARQAAFTNMGQVCFSGSRLFVHEKIYDEFIQKSVEKAKSIKIGDPSDPTTQQGPQIDQIQFNSIMNYIEKGKADGAKIQTGGKRHGNCGYYIEPTIFSDVKDNHTIAREEIFGPVLSVLKFSDYDEVIKRANDTCYGLAAGINTKCINLYQKLANGLRAGTIWINCYNQVFIQSPFGGFKNSGIGRENGENGLRNYLESKTVIVARDTDSLP